MTSKYEIMVSVDVGINALGWARWNVEQRAMNASFKLRPPLRVGVLTADRAKPWDVRLMEMLDLFREVVNDDGGCDLLVLEYAEFRASNAVGHAAAAKGSLTQLTFAAGAHAYMARDMWNADVMLVKPSVWKGQLPKSLVEKRITRTMGNTALDGTKIQSHAWDAVGLGLHARGYSMDHPVYSEYNKQ